MSETLRIEIAGEAAVMVYLGDTMSPAVADRVQHFNRRLRELLTNCIQDTVPSYASVLVLYRPEKIGLEELRKGVEECARSLDKPTIEAPGRLVKLPVWYGIEAGPDLAVLAEAKSLPPEAVVERHHSREYRVYAIGFAPGFAYLGEVDEAIAQARLAAPRRVVPRGAVGIADRQTAVYPTASPGGWNLIGRCPVRMFDALADEPMPVCVGDRIQFAPIGRDEFLDLGGEA